MSDSVLVHFSSEILVVRGLHRVCVAPVGVHNGTQEVLLISSSQHSAQFANQPDSESQPFLIVGLHGFGFG